MKTNFIMATDKTFHNGKNGFMVNIQGENPVEEDRQMFFYDPVKAIRYCFILKKQTGLVIHKEAMDLLSAANKARKEALATQTTEEVAPVEDQQTAAEPQEPVAEPAVEQPVVIDGPGKKRRGRPRKTKKEDAE